MPETLSCCGAGSGLALAPPPCRRTGAVPGAGGAVQEQGQGQGQSLGSCACAAPAPLLQSPGVGQCP